MTNEDWIARIGEVYGSPFRKTDGTWGIAVYLTEQQEEVVRERHRACCDDERYDEDYLKDAVAISIDKNGDERKLTITNGHRWQMQSDWNGNRVQKCDARSRTPAEDQDAHWSPPQASPAAQQKAREATEAAQEADQPKEVDPLLDKFMAGVRSRRASGGTADMADIVTEESMDTEPNPMKASREARQARRETTPENPKAEAEAQLQKLDLRASLTDDNAWTAWKDAVGELRGKPTKLDEGWGVQITPTARQTVLIEARQSAANDHLDLDAVLELDHLNGMDAVSVDRSGRERTLKITDSNTYGSRFDLDGNTIWTCTAQARQPNRYEPTKPVVRGADRTVGGDQSEPAAKTRTGTPPAPSR